MGEEFYCVIKLVSGEEILSIVSVDETTDEQILVLQNPVVVKPFTNQHGTFIKIKPWIELSDDDFYILKMDKVITLTETKNEKLIQMYDHYLKDDSNSIEVYKPAGQVDISNEMGYVSSVEEARKRLENLYKGLKES
jgi:hypothetical protein